MNTYKDNLIIEITGFAASISKQPVKGRKIKASKLKYLNRLSRLHYVAIRGKSPSF